MCFLEPAWFPVWDLREQGFVAPSGGCPNGGVQHGYSAYTIHIRTMRTILMRTMHTMPAVPADCHPAYRCLQAPTYAAAQSISRGGGRIWHKGHHPVPKPCPQGPE